MKEFKFGNTKSLSHYNEKKEALRAVDYSKALGVNIWNEAFSDISRKKKMLLVWKKIMLKTKDAALFHPKRPERLKESYQYLYIRCFCRADLNFHSAIYESKLKSDSLTVIFEEKQKEFSLSHLVHAAFIYLAIKDEWEPHVCDTTLNNRKLDWASRFSVYSDIFFSIVEIVKIYPLIKRSARIISFQEMALVENIIVQIAKNTNKKTFGLQHSIGIYKLGPGVSQKRDEYNYLTYRNSVCDVVLCWGEYTRQLYKKQNPKCDVRVVGRPIEDFGFIEKSGVALIFESDEKMNMALLKLNADLRARGVETSLWFKPGYMPSRAVSLRNGPLRQIVVGGRSSLLFQLGRLGLATYVLAESILADDLAEGLIIKNAEDLLEKIRHRSDYDHNEWLRFIQFIEPDCSEIFYQSIYGG